MKSYEITYSNKQYYIRIKAHYRHFKYIHLYTKFKYFNARYRSCISLFLVYFLFTPRNFKFRFKSFHCEESKLSIALLAI